MIRRGQWLHHHLHHIHTPAPPPSPQPVTAASPAAAAAVVTIVAGYDDRHRRTYSVHSLARPSRHPLRCRLPGLPPAGTSCRDLDNHMSGMVARAQA